MPSSGNLLLVLGEKTPNGIPQNGKSTDSNRLYHPAHPTTCMLCFSPYSSLLPRSLTAPCAPTTGTDQACSHHDSTVEPPSEMTNSKSMNSQPNQPVNVPRYLRTSSANTSEMTRSNGAHRRLAFSNKKPTRLGDKASSFVTSVLGEVLSIRAGSWMAWGKITRPAGSGGHAGPASHELRWP